jgi:succinate-acetate transporter protein
MSTTAHPRATTNGHTETDGAFWREHTRVFLQPIAAPAILGLFGFAGATFMVAAHLAGWYGNDQSGVFLFPFAAMFGGVAQFAAAMWSYRARDALATAMFGMFGSFWVAYGILNLLAATKDITLPAGKFPELAFWFWVIAAITAAGAITATARNLVLTLILATVAVGEAFLGVGKYSGTIGWVHTGGWVLVAAAIMAFYAATAMMLAATWGRTVLPMGEYTREATVPGERPVIPLQFEHGEPGVRQGQ